MNRRRNPAVVVGLDTMQGLQTARILAARNIEVHGIGKAGHPFSATSACASVVAASSVDSVIDSLETLRPRLRAPAVVFPCQDSAVRTISEHRSELGEAFLVALPDHEVVTTLMEKSSFHRHAEAHGLPVPKSQILRSRSDAEAAAAGMTFPCVLKPTSRSLEWSTHTTAKAFEIADGDQLLEIYDRVGALVESMIVQEWVVGPEDNLISVNAYFDEAGEPLATFVARKIRQWPVATGQSSLGVECRNDDVLALALETFSTVPYRGLAYLEVKQDSRTGAYFIVEPNIGRPTGRSAIAEAGGVELLDTMYCDVLGLPLPDRRTQTYGDAKWIHLRRDLMASAVLWRRGDLSLRQWRRTMAGPKYYAVWDPHDLRPFVGDFFRVGVDAVRGRISRRQAAPDARSTQ